MADNQLGFYFDANLCTGCKACQVACKDKWDLDVGITWRRVAEYSGGEWVRNPDGTYNQDVFSYYTSEACNHCDKTLCAEGCPSNAITKRDYGIVLIDEDKCIGCRYCEWACPYGAPQIDDSGVMTKCDLCHDYVDAGQKPACVSVCPMRALEFGDMDELRAKYGDLVSVHPLPDPDLAKPSVVFKPHKDTVLAESNVAAIANKEEI